VSDGKSLVIARVFLLIFTKELTFVVIAHLAGLEKGPDAR
jgi:hypothetical protein